MNARPLLGKDDAMGSLQNDLIRRARLDPADLTIRDNQVNSLVAFMRGDPALNSYSVERLTEIVRAGELKFMGIPVRVIGQPSR